MDGDDFVLVAALICEPVRARMLWKLLDGRAYTSTELALSADVSPTSASNHLSKLLNGNILKVDAQGRHRYYSFANDNVAYAVEALSNLVDGKNPIDLDIPKQKKNVEYCRTCYDHLAGYVGVAVTEAMVSNGYLMKSEDSYQVSKEGWDWLINFDITENHFAKSRRPLTRQCLDWSERRPHLAGQLGAVFLDHAIKDDWFRKVKFSRELVITSKGRQALSKFLGVSIE